jgi:DNA repair protein RadA/Sms
VAREKETYRCQECGYVAHRWLGRCPDCGSWNSLVLERQETKSRSSWSPPVSALPVESIADIDSEDILRIDAGSAELNRVLGGGIVPSSLVLVGGDPGIGKSTLLLALSAALARSLGPVLYVSGEESAQQIRLRAERLGAVTKRLLLFPETDLVQVEEAVRQQSPVLVVVDSIQTMSIPTNSSPPGSVAQIRECTAALLHLAKSHGVTIFIAGHVTKQGALAGPRLLEHMVDTVLYFEGEGKSAYRILRAVKNRFGSANEIAVFTMQRKGLQEVPNPSQLFLSDREQPVPGAMVVATTQGTRPLLVEVQALVSPTGGGLPRRVGRGVDLNRLLMLLAVLEKRGGLTLAGSDVYVNVAGGVRLEDPAADLGLALAIASSFRNRPCVDSCVAAGEVGLTGEVLSVSHLEARLKESLSLGFKRMLVPTRQLNAMSAMSGAAGSGILGLENVSQALELAFE